MTDEDETQDGTTPKVITGSLPPLTLAPGGSFKLARAGLSWFVRMMVFADGDPATATELAEKIAGEVEEAGEFLDSSERVAELFADAERFKQAADPGEAEEAAAEATAKAMNILMDKDAWPEKWAVLVRTFGAQLADEENRLSDEERQVVIWRLAKVKTMLLFTHQLEELTWRGYVNFGVDALVEGLTSWEESDKTEVEEFWQTFLQDRPYLVNLISPGPLAVHTGKAFLGGKRIDNTGGKIVDFLLEHSIGGNAALLEIKRPSTSLLSRNPYRDDIYAPSTELAGSIAQILNYRDTLMTGEIRSPIDVFMPSCIVLVGSYASELDSPAKRRSFELFRSTLNGVSVVTYDELFDRLKKILDVMRGQ